MRLYIKHGHLPGDVPKIDKISMLEASHPGAQAKAYRKMVRAKTRAVLKARAAREIGKP